MSVDKQKLAPLSWKTSRRTRLDNPHGSWIKNTPTIVPKKIIDDLFYVFSVLFWMCCNIYVFYVAGLLLKDVLTRYHWYITSPHFLGFFPLRRHYILQFFCPSIMFLTFFRQLFDSAVTCWFFFFNWQTDGKICLDQFSFSIENINK